MRTIVVRDIPEALYERLRQSARAHRRCINSEVIACIKSAVGGCERDAKAVLARAKKLRDVTLRYRITDEEINDAKTKGRL